MVRNIKLGKWVSPGLQYFISELSYEGRILWIGDQYAKMSAWECDRSGPYNDKYSDFWATLTIQRGGLIWQAVHETWDQSYASTRDYVIVGVAGRGRINHVAPITAGSVHICHLYNRAAERGEWRCLIIHRFTRQDKEINVNDC